MADGACGYLAWYREGSREMAVFSGGCDCYRGNRLFCSTELITSCTELSMYLFILPVLPTERKPHEAETFRTLPPVPGTREELLL